MRSAPARASAPLIDARMIAAWSAATSFARVMRRVPAGVAVVTVDLDGERVGLTVASLVSLSLEPPLVGVAIRRDAALHELLRGSAAFAVSLLAEGQESLAQHFARGVPPIALWEGVPLREADAGAPSSTTRSAGCAAASWRSTRPATTRSSSARSRAQSRSRARGRSLCPRPDLPRAVIDAVVFDLDGVLLDSEQVWDAAREQLARERGGRWHDESAAGHDGHELDRVVAVHARRDRAARVARGDQPRGRASASRRSTASACRSSRGRRKPSSGSRRPLAARARLVLEPRADRPRARATRRRPLFQATVSSEEVARGKPAPDVYLEAARRLGVDPARAAAVEDSHNGILAAKTAGMRVVAIPNRALPARRGGLARADVVLARSRS